MSLLGVLSYCLLLQWLTTILSVTSMECFEDEATCKHKTKHMITSISPENAASGRDERAFHITDKHAITGNKMLPPFPSYLETAIFGMGCFWSSEKVFYKLNGVYSTQVGYIGGYTKHPIYKEVKENLTGHVEVVRIVYDPQIVSYAELLQLFWQSHNPSQGMRQGIDYGTQYRSAIFAVDEQQLKLALQSKQKYQALIDAKFKQDEKEYVITTEIVDNSGGQFEFYYAEDYHQQYFYKNPDKAADCSMRGLGVECPVPLFKELFSDTKTDL